MKLFLTLIDAFFLTRPLLLAPVWGFSIFGLYRGMCGVGHGWEWPIKPLHYHGMYFLWMIVFSLSVASVYVLNQIADVTVDKCNHGTPLLSRGKVPKAVAWVTAVVCALTSLCAPLFTHPALSAFSASALLLGIVYSFPPLRFSGRCCFDFLANGAGYGIIAFGAGWYFSGAGFSSFRFIAFSLPYFLLMCAGSISSTLPDHDGDKKCNKNTTAVTLGIKSAHVMATFLLGAALITGIVLGDAVAALCAGCSLPLYVLYCVRPGPRSMEATYKGGGVLCLSAAAVLMPVAALSAIAIGLATWLYFKARHHTSYPSLVPVRHEE